MTLVSVALVYLVSRGWVVMGRWQESLDQGETVKINTLAMRRKMHYDNRNKMNLMS